MTTHDSFIIQFLAPYRWKGSPRTYENYRVALQSLESYCHDSGIEPEHASRSELAGWINSEATRVTRLGTTQSKSTLRLLYQAASLFYSWLVTNGTIRTNPMETMPRPTAERRIKEPFSEQEFATLLRTATQNFRPFARTRDVAILLLLIGTGARASELCSINVKEVIEKETLVLHGKGAKDRSVPLGDNTKHAIDLWLSQRGNRAGALFRTIRRTDLTYDGLWMDLRRLGDQAGIHCNPHRCRHTFAAEHYKRHHDPRALQHLLGHSSLQTTEMYIASLGQSWALAAGYETPDMWLSTEDL